MRKQHIGRCASWLTSLVLLGLATGCLSYRSGSVMHPQVETIAVGDVGNVTDEPALALLLRRKLAEHIMRDGSLKLVSADVADVVIDAEVRRYRVARSAAARARDDENLPENRTAYRTAIYNVAVDVDVALLLPSQDGRQLLPERRIRGRADFPELPDQDITRQSGLQQAVNDAAAQIVAAITEAW